ncbi:MAG TPA: hypothetical protein VM260_23540, partial [Pirellula sp.]|nr:hypothetical protein [Pirellula sp.]
NEVIFTLLPRIARPGEFCSFASEEDHAQASTPLLDRNLNPVDRRGWEGELPDASKKPHAWNWFTRKKKETFVPVSAVTAPPIVETQIVDPNGSGYANNDYPFPSQVLTLPPSTAPAVQGYNQ